MMSVVMYQIEEYLRESNAIEGVHDEAALSQAKEAWEYLKTQDTLTHETLKRVHELLLCNRQPDIAGEYRNVNVYVGNDTPPSPGALDKYMEKLLTIEVDSALAALQWHVKFEKIHPFEDGNGRVGRLVYLWHCEIQLETTAIMFTPNDRKQYYALFNTHPAPEEFL